MYIYICISFDIVWENYASSLRKGKHNSGNIVDPPNRVCWPVVSNIVFICASLR